VVPCAEGPEGVGTVALDIIFHGLRAPLRLNGGEAVLPILSQVAGGWPHDCRPADPALAPFFTIKAMVDGPLLQCQSHVEPKPARQLDPVNAVCDAMAALALALPAEDPRLICLHAAGVAMRGRLVVFPSVRRAGKSTLSVALSQAGHGLFADDVLPLSFTPDHHVVGQAMGIAPRLRLPLPDSLPHAFRDRVAADAGPANRQYQYLPFAAQPAQGVALPVGAFVILDRQDDPCPARLAPLSPDVAMDALLHQNFTRDRHSGDILRGLAAALQSLPVFRLCYGDLADAVAGLEKAFAAWPDSAPDVTGAQRRFRLADVASPYAGARPTGASFAQGAGTVAAFIGETLYLADAKGRAIHRMDALATAIWEVLADPTPVPVLEDLLADAFPQTARQRIAADLTGLLDRLWQAGLLAAV